jgi:FkbH-like protein
MKDFFQLKKNLKKDFSGLPVIKLAVLGDTATQLLIQALRSMGYEYGFNLQIWEADFNQIERQISDHASELYAFKPDIILLFHSTQKLLSKYNKAKAAHHHSFATDELNHLGNLYHSLFLQLNAKVIYYNYPEIDDAVFGSFATKTESSFLFQLRKLNYDLMLFAIRNANFYICDLSSVQNQMGKLNFFQPSIYVNTEMVLQIDALPAVASKTLDLISALNGRFKKCVILDLDNTVWGGIIGDDGIENIQLGELGIGKAFTELQHWIKKLIRRGIIVGICSKNTESVAKEPFENHPDMILRLDDIAVFIANWENKVDNLRLIQQVLNISFDSMVFLDDNPFERNMVREHLPDITVPELPDDPADYLEYLYTLNLFETISGTVEDTQRTRHYQDEAKRISVQKTFTDESSFLESLDMHSLVEPFNSFNTPRVAQLSQRSNQFNLRTVRYTEQDVKLLATSTTHFTFSFTLDDKFGENGLICVIVLKKENEDTLFIETWLMSCRVLKRSMENFVLNTIVQHAAEKGFKQLKGEYISTAKNEMVKDHYHLLGFAQKDNHWILDLSSYQLKKTFITEKEKVYGKTPDIRAIT